MEKEIRILYCDCAHAEIVPPAVKEAVFSKLRGERVKFQAVRDLCGMAARKDPLLAELLGADEVRIAACHPRAVKSLFEQAGTTLTDERARILNMRTDDAETVLSGLLEGDVPKKCACCGDEVVFADEAAAKDGWIPWFPVIDRSRCTNCRQCLSFCLFGVFGLGADGRVEVQQPANCKTGCPACSRVCPNVAIVFPKYDKSPINGDEVGEGEGERDPVKVDVGKLIEGGVQASLRSRTQKAGKRFSADRRPDDAGIARLRAMQAELDIPESVLNKLAAEGACACGCQSESPAAPSNEAAGDKAGACACECTGDGTKSSDPAPCGCSSPASEQDKPEKRSMDAKGGCSCHLDADADERSEDAASQEEWDL